MFKSFNFCLSTSLLYMSSSHHKPIEFRIKQLRQDKKNHSMFLYLLFYWACLVSSSPAPALAPSKEPCQTFLWRSLFSVKSRGDGAILEEPQIVAPPKRLWLLRRSASGGAVPHTPTTHAYIFYCDRL